LKHAVEDFGIVVGGFQLSLHLGRLEFLMMAVVLVAGTYILGQRVCHLVH
jgi:hypothetical protein